jgi:flagellin-like protein
MKNIKSQSGIIAAVLLILIVIVSALVVMSFVVPFVKKQLEGTGCLDVAGGIEIANNLQYTCYNPDSSVLSVQIHYGDVANLTNGFHISVGGGGTSSTIKIPEDDTKFEMYNGAPTSLPGNNEERTYNLSGISSLPEAITVYPILSNGDVCDLSDSITSITTCTSPL